MEGRLMLRLFILALLIYGLLVLWRKAGSGINSNRSKMKNLASGEMVACSCCGTFVLKNDAINNGGHIYCSEGCRVKNKESKL